MVDEPPVVLGDDFMQDKYTYYARLRRDAPVSQAVTPDGLRVWLVTRYEDARAALTDPALSKDSRKAAPLHERREREEGTRRTLLATVLRSHMLNMDPPDHTRLRRLVTKAFTQRRIEQLRPRVDDIVRRLLDGLTGETEVDLLPAYAFPLSATVSGELFGVPWYEREYFHEVARRIAFGQPDEAVEASGDMAKYLRELVALKRDRPADDLVTGLVQARDDSDRLDEDELVAMVFLLLSAGLEATGHLIGNAVLALLTNPDQLAALRADPDLLPRAVEELLRYDGPATATTLRFTIAPLHIGEVIVPKGEFVLFPLGAANRDETRFPDPDRLDLRRDTRGHLAFGHGLHHCLGAPLARLEAQAGIGGLLTRFPDLALAVKPETLRRRNSVLFNALETLPVTFSGQP